MEICRDRYLDKLIRHKHNGMIKVVQVSADAENHIFCLSFSINIC